MMRAAGIVAATPWGISMNGVPQIKASLPVAILSVALVLTSSAFAQKLVDPATVPPEHRAAAEKRRAEQIKQRECTAKADADKVLPRDRIDFIAHCIDADTNAKKPE